jgi:hypothetical protein
MQTAAQEEGEIHNIAEPARIGGELNNVSLENGGELEVTEEVLEEEELTNWEYGEEIEDVNEFFCAESKTFDCLAHQTKIPHRSPPTIFC